MEQTTNDLYCLPRMSPVEEPALPAQAGGEQRAPRMTRHQAMVLFGIGLILACGLLLFFVYGLSSMVPPDDPRYWRLVFANMFGLDHGGWVAIPASLGVLMGIGLVGCGIFLRNGNRLLITTAKVILAAAVSLGKVILGLSLALALGDMARPRPSSPAGDSAPIVVEADVKNWEPIYPDGPIDPASPDRQINVADDAIIVGVHNWIVRFKVTKVVSGVFEPDEVHMLIHSPSQFGIEAKGQRFVLSLCRRSERPRAIASSRERLSEGLSYFTFASDLYQLVSSHDKWRGL